MNGSDFYEILRVEFSAKNASELAKMLGLSPAAISILRKSTDVGPRKVANFISRIASSKAEELFESSIRPIVEYFPIDPVQKRDGGRLYPFDEDEHKHLSSIVRAKTGIYSFDNSDGKIIYLGKTVKTNLFGEMVQTYNRNIKSYHLFAVKHPRERYKPDPDGRLRKISRMKVSIWETATFFSCYSVSNDLIGPLEAFVIRLTANNLINTRMEARLTSVGIAVQA